MNAIRATIIACSTIMVGIIITLLYFYNQDRFEVVQGKDGVFVFDRKTSATNFCDDKRCILISERFMIREEIKQSALSFVPQQPGYPYGPQPYAPQMGVQPSSMVMAAPQYVMPPYVQPMMMQPIMPQSFISAPSQQVAPAMKNDIDGASNDASSTSSEDDEQSDDDKADKNSQKESLNNDDNDKSSDEDSDAGDNSNTNDSSNDEEDASDGGDDDSSDDA